MWTELNDEEMKFPVICASNIRAERTLADAENKTAYLKCNIMQGIYRRGRSLALAHATIQRLKSFQALEHKHSNAHNHNGQMKTREYCRQVNFLSARYFTRIYLKNTSTEIKSMNVLFQVLFIFVFYYSHHSVHRLEHPKVESSYTYEKNINTNNGQ